MIATSQEEVDRTSGASEARSRSSGSRAAAVPSPSLDAADVQHHHLHRAFGVARRQRGDDAGVGGA